MLNIVVFIKQVPDTNDVKWTENNNIDRKNMESILNPVDKQAIEAALFFKDNYNAHIYAVSMGPDNAKNVLREALSMGVDDAILLTDSKFAGSDTCATSRILSALIKEKLSDFDIIMFGQSAIDGETSQTGPSCAVRLNIPFITQVNKISKLSDNELYLTSDTDEAIREYKIKIPCALCINNYSVSPRLPKINGYIKAQLYDIKVYNHTDLALSEDKIGIKGSPTWVKNVFKNKEGRMCNFLDFTLDKSNCYNEILKTVKEAKINND